MVTSYKIKRVSKNLYLVQANNMTVKECASYKEAENFIFLKQSEELMYGYRQTA